MTDEEQCLLPPDAPSHDGQHRRFESISDPLPGRFRVEVMDADHDVCYLTPAEVARQSMYEALPYCAVFGMHAEEQHVCDACCEQSHDIAEKIAPGAAEEIHAHRKSVMFLDTVKELEIEDFEEAASAPTFAATPSALWISVSVAVISSFLVGYNTGVMNAPEAVVFPGHGTGSWSLAVAAFAAGGPIGANLAGPMADKRGRRGAILFSAWAFLAGGLVQSLAGSMVAIIVARFIIGFSSGFASVLVPIYLGEIAPPMLRGTLGTLTQFAIVIGILISNILAFPLAAEKLWRFLFSVTALLSAAQLLASPLFLESPRWLLSRDIDSVEARRVIKKLRGLTSNELIEAEVVDFVSASAVQSVDAENEKTVNSAFLEMLGHPHERILLISCLILQMAQQLSGINAVFYYSTLFFKGVISNPLVGTTLVGAVNVAATYAALLLMDSTGRRTLLLWSSGGMFLCCVVLVLSLLGYFPNLIALTAVNAYVCFFEIGLGPIPWLIVAEMFDNKYVASAMSASSQVNWACNFLVGLVFPFMIKYLGPYSFGPFAVVLLCTFLYTLFVLPETHGTTHEDLRRELSMRLREKSGAVKGKAI